MFEVLAGKAPSEAPSAVAGDGRSAAAGGAALVVLLLGVSVGGYYFASRQGGERPGGPALSAERTSRPATEFPRETPPPARREPEVASDRAAAPAYAVLVQTFNFKENDEQARKKARDEALALVKWLRYDAKFKDGSTVPDPRGIQIPGKSAFVVYVGGADREKDLEPLKVKMRNLPYRKSVVYFDTAFIVKNPRA